uniref:Uncharacterized protein n=1 Tax=Chlamydomonas euryale TaxID=1486919 RepID=A0A7R9YRY0_9CHLO
MGKGYKGRNPRGGKAEEEDPQFQQAFHGKASAGQNPNAGMLPPSDSEEEEDGGDVPVAPAAPANTQRATAGMLPPNSSDDDDDDSESSDDGPANDYLSAPRPKKQVEKEEKSAEEIAADMERLALIRKRREDDRLKRIATEGWDRYAPLSETNHPPGQKPNPKT